jgi:N-acyl amino acid synthase of PEP-CTERM/exosortase system
MSTPTADSIPRHFTCGIIDDIPHLLEESYRLRYQVYCLERGFLAAENYPDQREVDEFDPYSTHIGVLNLNGKMVGTARLIERSGIGLPLFHHCSLFPDAPTLDDPMQHIVEASRLAVSRNYNRRAGDGFYCLQGATGLPDGTERRKSGELVLNIFKGLYQASKRQGVTHWLAATEKSLQRLMTKYGFPFQQVGPETDYYGCVSPYLMDIGEFDNVILSRRIPLIEEFLEGLEPEFWPVDDDACCCSEPIR